MLSIGKLGETGALYYSEGLGAVDEYYSGAGTHTGIWAGAGADLLGLDGPVDPAPLSRVLGGGNPADGAPLCGSRSEKSVPGFDLCFRAPKSVSLLQALAEAETREAVLGAHSRAVADALGYLERDAIHVRRGHAGAIVEPGAGVVGAGFEHFTSRAGDPHLHTHMLVANMSRGPDGRWSALDARALYRHAKTAGYLYEASLRWELSRALGVVWGPVVNGIADIAGVPKFVMETFSKRRSQIVAELARNGASSPRAAQVAALATRPVKDKTVTVSELRGDWERTAGELGWGRGAWQSLTGPPRQVEPIDRVAVADRLLGDEGLTAHTSVFDRRDLLQAVAAGAPSGASVAQIEAAAAAVLGDDRAVRLDDGPLGGRWTTAGLLEIETALIDGATVSTAGGFAVVDEERVARLIAAQDALSGEQKTMIESLCRSGDAVQVVIGVAGAGKTYALGICRGAWEISGVRVVGTALSARAAKELSDGAKITSFTIARLLADLDNPTSPAGATGLTQGSVLVVDEAAMVSTRDLARLAAHAHEAGAKLVLVGDDRQLPAIGAGGTFNALAERLGAVELLENRRQTHGWERTALDHLRAGRVRVALAAYHSNDRRHHLGARESLHERLVSDWAAARAEGTKAMMLATRRDDVEALNRLARDHLRGCGEIGADIIQVSGRRFGVGDEIICTHNNRQVGVINGTRAVITGINPTRDLVVADPDGRRIILPARYLEAGHVAHGYATTIHKAQGATTERTFILADEHLYQEAGYVALSRGRDRNDLYTTGPGRDSQEGHGPTLSDVRDPLAVGLGRSRAQQAASTVPGLPGKTIAELQGERHSLALSIAHDWDAYRRAEQLDALIAQRKHALGVWAVAHPGTDHLEVLGEPPRSPERRAEWARAAGEMSAYREQHGIAYTREHHPELGVGWWEHHQVASVIREIQPALDLSHTYEKRHERDLGLGL